MDEWGRLTPAVNRFPSAANGASFKLLADYAHALGLKFDERLDGNNGLFSAAAYRRPV